jgi:hypothetical protein
MALEAIVRTEFPSFLREDMAGMRHRNHVLFIAKQPCLICGRQPSDAPHVRFAQSPALGRKVSDEFTVPFVPRPPS